MTCDILGDPSKPRSWSKYATDSSHNKVDKASDAKSKEKEPADSAEATDIKESKSKNKKEKNKTKKNEVDKKEDNEVRKALEKVQQKFS